MLVLRPIAAGQARYYLDGRAPGWWLGGGARDLGVAGQVEDGALHDVLGGRQPEGEVLLARVPRNRRSGFDLILAAPKSVSLLAALGAGEAEAVFLRAHEQAVRSTIGYLERTAQTRRGDGRIPTTGLVAAAFTHRESAAGDPHLHTHVVVANLVQGDDGRWSSLDSRSLYRHGRAAGAVYQASLRYQLGEHGLRFGWAVSETGLGDIVGVPRSAIDAASLRRRQVTQDLTGLAGPGERATAAGRTRRAVTPGAGQPWERRVAAAGLDQARAGQLIGDAMSPRARGRGSMGPPDDRSLAAFLTRHHSRFRRADVVRAGAILSRDGAAVADIEAGADGFLGRALPAGHDTWTTVGLRHLEDQILAAALPGDRNGGADLAHTGPPSPDRLARSGPSPPGAMTRTGRSPPQPRAGPGHGALERLTTGVAPVELLGGEFIGQAAVLGAARAAWEARGHRVALLTDTERAAGRWRALAGLEGPPPRPAHATVLLVDNADRRATADLQRVVADAVARRAKVVLIDGGSRLPRRQAESPAMEALRAKIGAIDPGSAALALSATPDGPGPREGPVVAGGRDGAVSLGTSAEAVVERIVADWSQMRAGGASARMVALGPAEAELLNARARTALVAAGAVRGPAVEIGGRLFQAGDEVTALRRDSQLGPVTAGTLGRVSAVDADRRQATIQWAGREGPATVGAATKTSSLAYAYATTPAYLRHGHDGPLLSLGDVETLAPHLHPTRVYEVMSGPAHDRAHEAPSPVAALLAEIGPPAPGYALAPGPPPAPGHPHAAGTPPAPGRPPASAGMPVPEDLRRPLSELAAESGRLAESLLAGVPADPRPELRRLSGERDWLASVPYRPGQPIPPAPYAASLSSAPGRPSQPLSPASAPGHPGQSPRAAAVAAIDGRMSALGAAADDRAQWLEGHRGELERWADVSLAMAWRETALGRAAEIRPTVAVESQLGPPPADASRRPLWRRAAAAVEAHRERWSLPDQPLNLGREVSKGPGQGRRAGELEVLAATAALGRAQGREHALSPGGR